MVLTRLHRVSRRGDLIPVPIPFPAPEQPEAAKIWAVHGAAQRVQDKLVPAFGMRLWLNKDSY